MNDFLFSYFYFYMHILLICVFYQKKDYQVIDAQLLFCSDFMETIWTDNWGHFKFDASWYYFPK